MAQALRSNKEAKILTTEETTKLIIPTRKRTNTDSITSASSAHAHVDYATFTFTTGQDHVCKGEDVFQKLNQCNYTNKDLGRIFTIMTLPASFDNLRTVLTSTKHTWAEVKQKIIEHDNQKSLAKISIISSSGQIKINAFNSQNENKTKNNNKSSSNNNQQHRQQNKPSTSNNSSNANEQTSCSYCKRVNHKVEDCRTKERDERKDIAHIKNRVPHSAIQFRIPFELWNRGSVPMYNELRPFGCPVVICDKTTTNPDRNPYSPSGIKERFLGYSLDKKASIVL